MAERPSASLSATGLTKRFGARVAVDGLTFRCEGPSVVGLTGPNGSGKTTLIRMLLGILKPTSGEATVNGGPPEALRTRSGPLVGYMPQGDAVYPELTVRQNVSFFGRIQGVPRERLAYEVERVLGVVALAERAKDPVGALSGGLRRRLSLACALVHSPDILFLDEPTVGVDPELRVSMWDEFAHLRAQGTLLLLSTHYMAEAERCDRVLLLREGRLLAEDAPAALMKRTRAKSLEDAFLALLREGTA